MLDYCHNCLSDWHKKLKGRFEQLISGTWTILSSYDLLIIFLEIFLTIFWSELRRLTIQSKLTTSHEASAIPVDIQDVQCRNIIKF